MILAGDIGGTNARLALYDDAGKRVLRSETFESRAHRGLEPIVTAFLGRDRPKAAALGVAGPVVDDRCRATNLPWLIDGPALGRRLGIPKVALLNDLVAIALGCLAAPA
ncbi:MAG: glucokinase, partial [Myxococcales bacterium]|nr:glucokinase [Myxococcales bacterium]